MIGFLQEDFAKAIRDKVRESEQYVASGKAETMERYKDLCGRIAGLKEALEIFNNVAKRHGELDDE